ncbi:NAD(P)-dependent dehydrogenase (short-subunit alcohol dehydrogenase family) [Murinocardiopsis flavida]|uniref:NAD(P)-dependent dehydrogenase (Short-subunit alcohol dehydrogenase family) n=1 Tax=Murinocardiopsis flavida TaxID=645275 RepID=A0A2P8D3D8_9ACTN|nr:SDR family oxidoreductase [Murinocardiopsis flavida]PSK91735.1 NAD(P)-dependent dehydrogenase (short-subunit alcohol dehydrogenase family) [Murinocardiopsis flavida]
MTRADRPVALVTGSASGIGAGIARRLADDGFAVAVHSRDSVASGTALAASIGGRYLRADLADEGQARALAAAAIGWRGRLDVLVNNAGISRPVAHADLAAAPPAQWRELLEVNLIAPWTLVTECADALARSDRDGGGAIVNITSHAGVRPKGASIPYAASKAALNHVTLLLAASLGPGVRVNAVAPGLVDTPLTLDWAGARALWAESAPMRRAARPEDVADMVSALLANSYVTGQIVTLDGGLHLR